MKTLGRTLYKYMTMVCMVTLALMGIPCMTALSADRETVRKDAGFKSLLMGTDVIYKGGMVTLTAAGLAVAGQATAGYKFAGVAYEKVDDSAGAGTKWCRVFTEGLFKFTATSITQAMVGQMMYLQDDQTIDDVPAATAAIPCGILVEYVSATEGWIDIGPAVALASAEKTPYIVLDDDYTVKVEESGTIFAIGTDAKTITLPATEKGLKYTFINIGSAGNNIITISPNASDKIQGNLPKSAGSNADATTADGLVAICAGSDDGDLVNTKATANPGDRVTLVGDGDAGWWITEGVGIWVGS